jgi:hypothetical protein
LQWNKIPNFCSLCHELVNDYSEHVGKRDHICMEIVFRVLCQYQRTWRSPVELVRLFTDSFSSKFKTGSGMGAMHRYEALDQRQRRQELLLLLMHLQEREMIFIGRDFDNERHGSSTGISAFLVLHEHMMRGIVAMIPMLDQKDVACLAQMCSATYNCETVYDLCGFDLLMKKPGILAPQDLNTSEWPASSGNGAAHALHPKECPPMVFSEPTYSLKAACVRRVLGQLRFALADECVGIPPVWESVARGTPDTYLYAVAQTAVRMLIAEIIACKVMEYAVRVEPTWRRCGSPTMLSNAVARGKDPLDTLVGRSAIATASRPPLHNEGWLQFASQAPFRVMQLRSK